MSIFVSEKREQEKVLRVQDNRARVVHRESAAACQVQNYIPRDGQPAKELQRQQRSNNIQLSYYIL